MDKAAVVLGVIGCWIFTANVEPGRWGYVICGAAIMLAGVAAYKIGEKLEQRREELKELEEQRRDEVFAAFVKNPIKYK